MEALSQNVTFLAGMRWKQRVKAQTEPVTVSATFKEYMR